MPILATYIEQTQQLLQLPQAGTQLYSDESIIGYINRGRGQLAGDAECIRVIGTIATVINQRPYNFTGINIGNSSVNGVAAPFHVRRINYGVGDGQKQISARPWEWYDLYAMNNVVPVPAAPTMWAQYGQGAAPEASGAGTGGSFYLDPPPDIIYTLYCDCVCWPVALTEESEPPEALPYPWTDAVPYYAAYLALMSAQTNARVADAERIFNMYSMWQDRARKFANPSVLRWQYSQATDPAQINKLSVRPPAAGQQ